MNPPRALLLVLGHGFNYEESILSEDACNQGLNNFDSNIKYIYVVFSQIMAM